jgi:DNA polymerase-4
MDRRILHVDMDAFFASVEQVHDPSLKGKPVIVGGTVDDRRGVVSTASYEAREFGVHSAMPLSEAKRRCPHGIFMRGNHDRYRVASQAVIGVLRTVTPTVQVASIDEAYLDLTGSLKLFGGEEVIAAYIKEQIHDATSLTCTIGIAANKLVAKIASAHGKPDGYLRIAQGDEASFLAPLPIEALPGIGTKTQAPLKRLGIQTVGELAVFDSPLLQRTMGPSSQRLQRMARGESNSTVRPQTTAKSISRETTFAEDRIDWPGIESTLAGLAERAAHALRQQGLEARHVTLKVRYADFQTLTFGKSLTNPTAIDQEFIHALNTLIPKAKARRTPIRLIGLTLGTFTDGQHQLALFDNENNDAWNRVLSSVDRVRDRHGLSILKTARAIRPKRDGD